LVVQRLMNANANPAVTRITANAQVYVNAQGFVAP